MRNRKPITTRTMTDVNVVKVEAAVVAMKWPIELLGPVRIWPTERGRVAWRCRCKISGTWTGPRSEAARFLAAFMWRHRGCRRAR